MPTRVAGLELTWPAALINIYKQSNAKIEGEGTIDGDGKVFWDSYWALRKIDEPKGLRWASDYDAKRPRLIQVFDSSSVHIGDGLQLRRSGFWTVHICYSHDVTVDGVTIRNNEGGRGPSTDGIDIDSSTHIEVMHADIAVNDDALCMKAGRDSDGLRVNRPTTDVKIHDNIVRDGAAGITFGSETSGGFRNIEAWNITAQGHVPVGILFKSAHTRGGFADDIRLHDMNFDGVTAVLRITMNWNPSYSYATIPPGLTDYPAYYKTLTTPVPEDKGRAHVSNVHIWTITATNAKTAFEVDAYPQVPLEHFKLEHIDITAATAGHISDASDWTFIGRRTAHRRQEHNRTERFHSSHWYRHASRRAAHRRSREEVFRTAGQELNDSPPHSLAARSSPSLTPYSTAISQAHAGATSRHR